MRTKKHNSPSNRLVNYDSEQLREAAELVEARQLNVKSNPSKNKIL